VKPEILDHVCLRVRIIERGQRDPMLSFLEANFATGITSTDKAWDVRA